eukprot:XP_001704684.1 Hypothetical protein GL50803_39405 [Giardia lamblia ATCC 50803]
MSSRPVSHPCQDLPGKLDLVVRDQPLSRGLCCRLYGSF